MNISQFYQPRDEKGYPLYLISEAAWRQGIPELTAYDQALFNLSQFKGKLGDICLITNTEGALERAYIGTGAKQEALAMAYAATRLPGGCYKPQAPLSQTAIINWALAQYQFREYKQTDELNSRCLSISDKDRAVIKSQIQAIFFIRDLINRPTNDLGPKEMGAITEKLAHEYQATVKQWVDEDLLNDNFPAIYIVGRAAADKPRLISLTWGNPNDPSVCIVGKGVCFDSGGLDIKPSNGMRLMKKDMGGAAHALGLAQWIMDSKLPIYLNVLIPAIENAVGPQSFRPGDVLTMRNGLTVEVDNTDAEGRLILADALVKAEEFNPELIIDFATLTGSARVAVGTEIAAMFTNDNELAKDLIHASEAVDDPIWQLPLFKNYQSLNDSSIADLSNCPNSPYAGAITAALFLERFISKPVSWVHFDIMAWNVTSKPGKPEGGEAMAIRALAYFLQKKYS